jgi:tRNA-2-methylthio-N6-dimethylallyladenosine synthase
MNRGHTRAEFMSVVERLLAIRPDMAFTSDIIVGFPGETDEDFEETMQLVNDVPFTSGYAFNYSTRPGTPAAERIDQVPEHIKTTRLHRLQARLEYHRKTFNLRSMGMRVPVLFDKPGRLPGQMVGRSMFLQPVHVTADASILSTVADVEVNEINSSGLFGTLVSAPRAHEAAMELQKA